MMAIHTRTTRIQQLSVLSTLQLTCSNVHFFQIHILKLRYNSSFRFILCLYNHSKTHSRFFFLKILNTLILDYFISFFRNMACFLHKNY